VTDLPAMEQAIAEQCPDLVLEKDSKYRTWLTDHGSLVGDAPLPGLYQLHMVAMLAQQGVDVRAEAKKVGVELPENLLDLEQVKPWTLKEEQQLRRSEHFREAYDHVTKKVMGQDAEYVVRPKPGHALRGKAYELGLVPHPLVNGRYALMTDYYNQGNGLLKLKGVGQYTVAAAAGSDKPPEPVWAAELKQTYNVLAAKNAAKQAGCKLERVYKTPEGHIVQEFS